MTVTLPLGQLGGTMALRVRLPGTLATPRACPGPTHESSWHASAGPGRPALDSALGTGFPCHVVTRRLAGPPDRLTRRLWARMPRRVRPVMYRAGPEAAGCGDRVR